MSLSIYLDECAIHYILRDLLIDAGHDVQIPSDVDPPLLGAKDDAQFAHAQTTGRILFTFNPHDFIELHEQDANHSGIFVVYQENNVTKDMTYPEIVKAIQNLQETGIEIAGNYWILNQYRW